MENPPTNTRPRALKLLALGDSYTIGEGVPAAERWPAQLATRLLEDELRFETVELLARTGWSAAELADAVRTFPPHGPYDLVTLMAGVNDQYRGGTIEDFEHAYRGLLGRAVELAGGHAGRVLAISIPDWGATPFAADRDRGRIAREIDAYNSAARACARTASARWIDVTPLSRQLGADPAQFTPDRLHPAGAQYAAWVGAMRDEARAAFAEDGAPPARD